MPRKLVKKTSEQNQLPSEVSFSDITLDQLSSRIPAMVCVINLKSGKYVYVNKAVTKLVGYDPEEFMAKGFEFVTSLIHPDDVPAIIKQNNMVLKKAKASKRESTTREQTVSVEYRMRHKAGHWVWLYSDVSIYDWTPGGKAKHIMNMCIDITDRKESEIRLREMANKLEARAKNSSEQLQAAIQASKMGIWEWNIETNKVSWSNELKQLYGLKASDEVSYEKYFELIHPDDVDKMRNTIEHAQKTGRKYSFEHRIIWPDGSIHWVLGKGQAFKKDGKTVRMAGISLDINARKKAEELYQRQNEYLSVLNETALEVSKGIGNQNRILQIILEKATRLSQTSSGYIYINDRGTSQLAVRAASGVFKSHLGHKIKSGEGLAGKVWKTGKFKTVGDYDSWQGRQKNFPKGVLKAAIGVPLYSGSERIGVIALAHQHARNAFPVDEVTALKRLADLASIALDNARLYRESQEREQRFSMLADNAPVLIWMAGAGRHSTYFNKTWTDFTGRKLKSELGKGWMNRIHPDDIESCLSVYSTAFDNRQPCMMEYRLKHHSGQYRWVLDNGSPRYSSDGAFLGYIGSCIDIEDLKSTTIRTKELEAITASLTEQRAQLVELNSAKDEFISLASHQLRTPATGVKQFLGMLLENYFGELADDQRTMLEYAYESNERQLEVINDLLRVAQVDAGKVLLSKENHDIADMLEDIMQEQRSQFARRKQKVILDRPKEPVFAPIDERRMRMVVENLIDNASKYTPEGKRITVTVDKSKNGETALIKVKDEGVGIAESDMPKLFQKFSRLENPLSVQVGGTGIGLYWAKKIVDLHGGTINLQSKPGKGSTFIVRIPA